MQEGISRRKFLTTAGAGLSAIVAAPAIAARPLGASDKIVLAAIGVGGRSSTLISGFASRSDVHFATLCDVDPGRGGDMMKLLTEKQGAAPQRVQEMRRVLDDKSIDAVVIGTPDHWHGPASIFACQAGKHVYVEKPPSHNVWEGRKMVEAARRYKRVVQVGTQNRSAPYAQKALEYIQKGELGKIHLCKVYNLKSGGPFRAEGESAAPPGVDYDAWLGPAPKRAFSRSHFHGSWHAWWAYSGGDLADDGIHQLDLARWLCGKESPRSVVATGGKLAFPDSDAEVPDTQLVQYDFGDLLMTFEQTGWAPYMDKIAGDIRNGAGSPYWPQCATRIELYGTKGLMLFGRHGGSWQAFHKSKAQSRQGELVAQELGRFPDAEHQADFLDAIRHNRRSNADVEEGHRSATLVHLANISTRLGGRRLEFDGKSETIVGDAEAAAFLKREYRAPYVVPEIV